MSLSNNPVLAINQVLARIHDAAIGDGCFDQGISGGLDEWCEMICESIEEQKEGAIGNMDVWDVVEHLNDVGVDWEDYDLVPACGPQDKLQQEIVKLKAEILGLRHSVSCIVKGMDQQIECIAALKGRLETISEVAAN